MKTDLATTHPLDSTAHANREFIDLATSLRVRALWFLAPGADLHITHPEADGVLKAIARVGNRSEWLRARRLQAWRSRHCK